jgi:MYXO-CTERM domain-containing protein
MRSSKKPWALLAAGLIVAAARTSADAKQFVLTQKMYTHPDFSDGISHVALATAPGVPTNWKSPINYAEGLIHLTLDVRSKPSDVRTWYQICIWAPWKYTCGYPVGPFTKPGLYKRAIPLSQFWQYDAVDFTKFRQVFAVVKADNNVQITDPKNERYKLFYPMNLSMKVTIVAKGDTYQEDEEVPPDAGVPTKDAQGAQADAMPAPADAGVPAKDAATSPPGDEERRDAAASVHKRDARKTDAPDDQQPPVAPQSVTSGGCAVGATPSSWGPLALLLLLGIRRRRS